MWSEGVSAEKGSVVLSNPTKISQCLKSLFFLTLTVSSDRESGTVIARFSGMPDIQARFLGIQTCFIRGREGKTHA